MKTFEKNTLNALTKELEVAMNEVLKQHGVTGRFAGGNFTEFEAKIKFQLNIATTEAKENKMAETENRMKAYANIYGLTVKSKDGSKLLVDYKPRNHKYPFIYLEARTGKRFKTTLESAKRMFAA